MDRQSIYENEIIGDPLYLGLMFGGYVDFSSADDFEKALYPGLRAISLDGVFTLARDLPDAYSVGIPHSAPGLGVLGYAQVTSGQSGISSETDLTGLSVTVTAAASRRLRISGHCGAQQQTSTGTIVGRIKEGSTNLGRFLVGTAAANAFELGDGSVIVTPSAGSHTYKLALLTTAGTVNMLADSTTTHGPAYVLVEDIGSASPISRLGLWY